MARGGKMKVDLTKSKLKRSFSIGDILKLLGEHTNLSYKTLLNFELKKMILMAAAAKVKDDEKFFELFVNHADAWLQYGYVLAKCGVDLMDIVEVKE